MFRLKLPTDPRWVNIVEQNISEILTDHAYCEQKAASNAISMTILYPELSDLVQAMLLLAEEEIQHFKMVHDKILERGFVLGKPRKDEYVNQLYSFLHKGGSKEQMLIDRLLYAAIIEARSCERFRVIAENIADKELATFYRMLMISEANHYTIFINFANKYAVKVDVEKRWQQFLNFEGEIIKQFGVKETVHG